ncbi:peptide ABC transporter ATP-binding protein [Rathayibacter caricis DSM 15933]|uniref:Peptide ABC transporter ATP-binding protein n=1 Tax=Rathayibacter caricis DSM 15933 TaxID=1328867 RepID=A0A2T4UR21_9MICO|nr:ATP-binding cassette domain-containing protein [Rathayibacter caricis]PTL71980.1 peptide ABC transporter ATP-binding protein [Rathayibacter caricis DSM 15933]
MTALVETRDLAVSYPGRTALAKPVPVLSGVSIAIEPGRTLGLVGESGSGKTTLGRAILGLAPVTAGSILFEGRDVSHLHRRGRRALAADIQVVFQDPYTSLNPSMTIEQILAEPLWASGTGKAEARRKVRSLLSDVGLPADSADRLPREFSGGQRQRIAIARALALQPKLIVCDEPVSALDLTTQARVLDLFIDIQASTGVSYLFVTHDLAVVRYIAHEVAVMQGGTIVEQGDAAAVTEHPRHPYTQQLLLAAPIPDPAAQRERRAQRQQLASTLP